MSAYINEVFDPGGCLSQHLDEYESRPGQVQLATTVDRAFSSDEHVLVEGPPGSGKSIGALVPAVYHAVNCHKRVLVVTASILLQEQLVNKDLPFLEKALPWEYSFALVKGRSNYLCPDRLREDMVERMETGTPDAEQGDHFRAICEWSKVTSTGDVSELPFTPHPGVWRRVCGDGDECDGQRCEESACYVWKAREAAHKADIVVCNYHLLFSHLKVRADLGRDMILPPFDLAILDEGHAMADIARDFFGYRVTEFAIRRLGRALIREGQRDLAKEIRNASRTFFAAARKYKDSDQYHARIRDVNFIPGDRILAALKSHQVFWKVRKASATSDDQARRVARRLALGQSVKQRLSDVLKLKDKNCVYWIDEDDQGRLALAGKPVDVAGYLNRELFDRTQSAVVTSATLTTGGRNFGFIRNQIGLHTGQECVVQSPFNFPEQALLVIPEMATDPASPSFTGEIALETTRILDMIGGKCLGLFTSYKNMHAVHERIAGNGHRILMQGEQPRSTLVKIFKEDLHSVLLGTTSFWTGVDIPGEALTCLLIDKLPFPTPDDPIMDVLREQDPQHFIKHFIPRAVIALRQGFGRLIRTRSDVGVVVIFDTRILSKPYGKIFLRSLPDCRTSRQVDSIRRFLGQARNDRDTQTILKGDAHDPDPEAES